MSSAADAALPFTKISIPGPTLSSLLHHCNSSSSVCGLLFGHVTALPSAGPTDDDPSLEGPTSSLLSLTVTSFLSSPYPLSFLDPLALVVPTSPLLRNPTPSPNSSVVGWFCSRPRSQLRPSMRELAASHHLARTLTLAPAAPVFLLLSSFSTANLAVHTHEYRAFVLPPAGPAVLRPISIDVINVGPKFRGQYGAFSTESAAALFPMRTCRARVLEEGGGTETEEIKGEEGEGGMMMDWEAGRLEGLMGERAVEYTGELEELYRNMMGKLERLVRVVESSSAKVQEQVPKNWRVFAVMFLLILEMFMIHLDMYG